MRKPPTYRWRRLCIYGLLAGGLFVVLGRLVYLNIIDRHFLLQQSDARIIRTVPMPAYRGMIVDRLGLPLAISSPVMSVWVNPKLFRPTVLQERALLKILQLSRHDLMHLLRHKHKRVFVYLKRRNSPTVAKAVAALNIPGVFLQKEYKRFYPEGEVTAHVVGLTNIDDAGQEGLELAFNQWLSGTPGKREVLRDRLGQEIQDIGPAIKPVQGHQLVLSLDHRIQYIAYRALKEAVTRYHAASGSVVVLDNRTGEVLAMVNQPSYNPNNRPADHDGRYRNRAVTDMFEPGSTIKPFNIALALESGRYTPMTMVDTSPGRMRIGGYLIKDDGLDYGRIDVTQVLQHSSNIGAAKILLSLQPNAYWQLLHQVGFGAVTDSGFPGESAGHFVPRSVWYPSVIATLAYGYGVSVTTLQLAHAYAVLANAGLSVPVTLLKQTTAPQAKRVLPEAVAQSVVKMLETVVVRGGTGIRAAVPGYEVAGKTGTAFIAGPKGYQKNRFISDFVGMAPASHPQLVVAVMLRDPKGQHYGGLVAAPVFAKVMGGALRVLDVPPDGS